MTTDTNVHHTPHPTPDGDRAVEVVGMLAESVVDVKHLEAHARKPTKRPAYLMMAAGALMLLVSAGAFAKGVSQAAANQRAKDHWVNIEMKKAIDFRPERLGIGWDVLAFGGLGAGLLAFTFGFARLRSRVAPSSYTIGRDRDADFAIEDAPVAAFPLVAQRDADMVVTVPATMNATLIRDGATHDLDALAALGVARPSATLHGARELTVPATGAIRIDNGLTRFHVRSVPKQRSALGAALTRFDRQAAKFFGLSALAHLAVVLLLGTIPPSATTLTGENADDLVRMVSFNNKAHETPVAETQPNTGTTSGTTEQDAPSAAASGDEGKAGDPTANVDDRGALAIKDREDFKHKSRDEAVTEAREAGFLGVFKHNASMLDSFEEYSVPSGYDQFDNNGIINGDGNGPGFGKKGMGFRGEDDGGGNPDGDTIKAGDYNTIPRDDGKTGRNVRPLGDDDETTKRETVVPPPVFGPAESNGELDKSIIRRRIRAQMERFRHCFEVAMLASPNLSGTIDMQFFISPQGKVISASVTGVGDASFHNCIKDVLESIKFPAPTDGGTVHVTSYTITFRGPSK